MNIAAMKQALEHLDLIFAKSQALNRARDVLHEAIEQAEQTKPVAVYRAGQAPGEVYHVQFFKEMNADEVLLYTAPLQRQPLTDEGIDEIEQQIWSQTVDKGESMKEFVYKFARAIEAAHGIKGEA